MRAVSGSSVLHRLASSVLGPRPLTPASLWAAHGRRALSAGFCVTAPLALFVALGRPDLGAAAALGGFTAVYGHALPYRRRAGVSAGVGAVLVSAVVLGGIAGAHPFPLAPGPGPLGAAGPPGAAGLVLRAPGPPVGGAGGRRGRGPGPRAGLVRPAPAG